MTIHRFSALFVLLCCGALARVSAQGGGAPIGVPHTLTTLPLDSEGLAVDRDTGTLYTAESPDSSGDCIVRSITMTAVVSFVGVIPRPVGEPCAPRGLEFREGHIYIADQGTGANGWVFEMDPATGQATTFAVGVAGANGLAFDWRGSLWITDGLRGFGRVYRRSAATGVVEEMVRVPPVANGPTYGGRVNVPNASGIGRLIANVPSGPAGEVKHVANGIAVVDPFDDEAARAGAHGQSPLTTVYVADTARGAVWAIHLNRRGDVAPGQTGCDPTLQQDTLCDDALFIADPRLEGADGLWAGGDGTLWVSVAARQALVRIDRHREVTEIFRNPVNSQLLRSSADTADGNTHLLEYPTSVVIVPRAGSARLPKICVTSSDRPGRDNWPGTVGEIGAPGQDKGKISCF